MDGHGCGFLVGLHIKDLSILNCLRRPTTAARIVYGCLRCRLHEGGNHIHGTLGCLAVVARRRRHELCTGQGGQDAMERDPRALLTACMNACRAYTLPV